MPLTSLVVPRLVVVDDDPFMVKLLETVLVKRLGGRVELFTYTDLDEARYGVERHGCDLLLAGCDTLESAPRGLLAEVKRGQGHAQIVLLTAVGSTAGIHEGLEAGANDFLLKPVDPRELVEVVGQQLERLARWQRIPTKSLAHA